MASSQNGRQTTGRHTVTRQAGLSTPARVAQATQRISGRGAAVLSGGWAESLFALLCYASVAVALFGLPLSHGPSKYLGWGTDPGTHVWFLAWWPHAISQGIDPVITKAVWAPHGYNLAWATSMPGPSVLMSPITALWGPVAAYNLLGLLAPTLSAWTAYLLCRRVTGTHWPSLVGGYLFGFSTYQLGHLMGHPNLTLVFLVPVCVILVLRRLEGELRAGTFVLALAGVIVLQLLTSTEVMFTLTIFGVAVYALAMLIWRKTRGPELRRVGLLIGIAYAVAATLASPFIFYLAKGSSGPPVYSFYPSIFSTDLLNLAIPTSLTILGRGQFEPVAARFTGNVTEQVGYLGLPMLLILLLFAVSYRRSRTAWLLLLAIGLVLLCSLGPRLRIGGIETVALPWRIADALPVFRYALPSRFIVYVFLAVGVVVSMWLSGATHGERVSARTRTARWILALLAAALLFPNLAHPYWKSEVDVPAFFGNGVYRDYLAVGDNALIIPFGDRGNSMLWQAKTGFHFRMPEGYLSVTTPSEFANLPILETFYSGRLIPNYMTELRAFLRALSVDAIVVVEGTPGPWRQLFLSVDPSPLRIADVILYRVSS
jgi:hypothetical protein